MPEVLLGEILENQISKSAIFHIKSFFYKTTEFSAWTIDQKNSRKSPKFDQKEGRNSIFSENSLS